MAEGLRTRFALLPAVGEHLLPLIEGDALRLEKDVLFLQQTEAALLVGGVVLIPPGPDGPGHGVEGACDLQAGKQLITLDELPTFSL